jgi:hypothetical protein
MLVTTFSFEESSQAPLSDVDFTSRRSLRLLLEAVKQDDASPAHETVDDPVDVRPAFFSKLPKLAVELLDKRLSGRNVPDSQLLD